jgi:ATP-dependent protease ClpP protease subunit
VYRGWAVSILSVVLTFVPPSLVRADVVVYDRTETSLFIDISGTITNLDAKTFEDAIQDLGSRRLYIRLDSVGGDVFAAMNIGRLIRKHDGVTIISVPSRCYSGCALIFIAGVMRHNLGELGLHRPYQVLVLQDRQTNEKQLARLLTLLRQYVAEMGAAEDFYDQMINTGHTETAIYRIDTYANLVPEIDPGFLEVQFTYGARRYGMTAEQMRQREKDAEVCLTRAVKEIVACQEAIKWGLSEQLYRERNAKIKACELGHDDRRTLQTVPPGRRRDHPLVLKHEACQQKIMLGR